MKRLFCFEIRKILTRKLVWAGLALAVLLNVSAVLNMGLGNVAYEQEVAAKYEGVLDDGKVKEMLEAYMPDEEQRKQWGGANVAYIGRDAMQMAVQYHFANPDGTWNGKSVEDVFGKETVRIGFHSGWFEESRVLVRVTLLAAIVVLFAASPVFAGEYAGMDNIILAARYGRERCAIAKAAAMFAVAFVLALVFLAANLAIALSAMGTDGLDSSVLFCGVSYAGYIPFNISCGTMLAYQSMLSLAGLLMLTGMVLCVSALAATPMIALASSSLLFLLPLLLPAGAQQGILRRVVDLLPVKLIQFTDLMSVAQIRGNLLYAAWGVPAGLAVAAVAGMLAEKIFAAHHVK